MVVIVMTSLPAADCSRSLLLQSETRGRRWFDGVSVVQPVPMSIMTVGVVDLEVQQLAADRQSCRPARVHGDTVISAVKIALKGLPNEIPLPDPNTIRPKCITILCTVSGTGQRLALASACSYSRQWVTLTFDLAVC